MTRDEIIERFGSIEEAKDLGWSRAPMSNNWVQTVGKGKATPRKYTRCPKGDSRHKSNSTSNEKSSDEN